MLQLNLIESKSVFDYFFYPLKVEEIGLKAYQYLYFQTESVNILQFWLQVIFTTVYKLLTVVYFYILMR